MQNLKPIIYNLLVVFLLASCNNKPTLQTYFVDNQELPNFTTLDIPTSIVNFDKVPLSASEKEAYQSIKKLNFLGFKLDSTNQAVYQIEKQKVKDILNDSKYIDLGDLSMYGNKVSLKYVGKNDIASEFIVFGSSADLGFGVLRILGNDMRPEKIFTLLQTLQKGDMDTSQLDGIKNFFL